MKTQVLAACVAFIAGASASATPVGSERAFHLGGFDAIETTASDRVEIERGSGATIVARGDPAALASLSIKVVGRTLVVGRTPGTHTDRGATISITMPVVRALTVEGSGSIRADAAGDGRLAVTMLGSGRISLPALRLDELRVRVDGSGDVELAGQARAASLAMGGSGGIHARSLNADAIEVALGGSGTIAATASRSASVSAGGSGSVTIEGHPACAVSGGGTARVVCG